MTPTSIEGVTGLARESALSLGHLIGQHVKVARLEIAAEVRTMGRRATAVAVLAALVAIGYALAIAGVAVVIGGGAELGIPLVVIGLAHVVGAGAGLVFGPLRARASHLHAHGQHHRRHRPCPGAGACPLNDDRESDAAVARAVAELEDARDRFSLSMIALERGVARSFDWRAWVGRKPGTALALAFGLGIFLGRTDDEITRTRGDASWTRGASKPA